MDTLIERKKRFTPRRIYGGAGVLFILVFVFYFIFRDTGSSMTIDKSRITIATVTENEFNDYVRVIGQVLPSRMIYLDAIEGGRVEERLHEEGAMVKKGDVILRLSNPLLNIGIMQSEADLAYQENELRNTRISMEQERLSLKQDRIGIQKEFIIKKRRYGQYKRLMEGQLIAREDYLQATEEYEAVKEQLSVLDERIRQDSLFRLTQISSLDENIMNMKRSLALVRERLENLKVKAPIDGQVGNLEAQIGQSISAGEHIGQIITADLKVQALIDEHYVERVVQELPADFTRDGENYKLEVTKVYPEVKDGQFRTDFRFTTGRPENIRAGQTYHINLQLGDPVKAVLIPRGGFFQITGGRWIYVVDESGKFAVRRPIKIGRQNPQFYEVTDGLASGEKVIISGYELFGDNEKLILNEKKHVRMIKVENLSMLFSTEEVQTKALNEVTFEIEKGEFVAIMGPSGCGKSTLLNILGTLDTPTSGSYLFEGKRVDKMNENQLTALRKGNIGFIFQSFNLIDELTVYENVELPLVYLNIKPTERNRRVKEVLEKVNMLHRANHLPQQLSGGQQQRVAIARAVVTNARLLLADEPTGNLDSTNGVEVMELLSTLNKQGTTIIIVTHSQRDAAYAHRIIRLLDGKIIAENRNRPMESDSKIEIL